MKKITAFILALILFLSACNAAFASVAKNPLKLDAKAAVLVDTKSGKILYSYNARQKRSPASVTKVMSLILVAEAIESGKISLKDVVVASKNAAALDGTEIYLKTGEKMTVNDLIKATVMASANDACTALAEHVAGSRRAFVKMMNAKAKQLGMKNTHFQNCTGLDVGISNHYTTALDIVKMSAELMKHKLMVRYTTTWIDKIRGGKTTLVNTNKLLRTYKGCIGLKTGMTTKAGYCLSSVVQKGNTRFCGVILGSKSAKNRFKSMTRMLNYGYRHFQTAKYEVDLSQAGNIGVNHGEKKFVELLVNQKSLYITVPRGKGGEVDTIVRLDKELEAPVRKNQVVGTVSFSFGSKELKKVNILAKEEIKEKSFENVFRNLFKSLVTNS